MEKKNDLIPIQECISKYTDDFPPYKSDYFVFCDGSGSSWNKSIGYSSIILDCANLETYYIEGFNSFGTNNYAEILPILLSLSKINSLELLFYKSLYPPEITILSDSLVTVNCGNGIYSTDTNNSELWAAINYFKTKLNWKIKFIHVPRNCNEVMSYVDRGGKEKRAKEK